jgi:hypothetical protein
LGKWEDDMVRHRKEVEAYYKVDADLYDKFKIDVFNELGISDNPKRDLLFSIAWEMGHSSGYAEVFHYACEMVDLIV